MWKLNETMTETFLRPHVLVIQTTDGILIRYSNILGKRIGTLSLTEFEQKIYLKGY